MSDGGALDHNTTVQDDGAQQTKSGTPPDCYQFYTSRTMHLYHYSIQSIPNETVVTYY